jgi:hypothetical protein
MIVNVLRMGAPQALHFKSPPAGAGPRLCPSSQASFWLLLRGIPIGPSVYSRQRHQDGLSHRRCSIWREARSRAAVVARPLPDVPSARRLTVDEAAPELGADRSTVNWRSHACDEGARSSRAHGQTASLHCPDSWPSAFLLGPYAPASLATRRKRHLRRLMQGYRYRRPPDTRPYAARPPPGEIADTPIRRK